MRGQTQLCWHQKTPDPSLRIKSEYLHLLGLVSLVKQLLGFADVLRGFVDDAAHVGEVGHAVPNLHDHLVHGGLVDG